MGKFEISTYSRHNAKSLPMNGPFSIPISIRWSPLIFKSVILRACSSDSILSIRFFNSMSHVNGVKPLVPLPTLSACGLLFELFQDLRICKGHFQNKYHKYDVLEHHTVWMTAI